MALDPYNYDAPYPCTDSPQVQSVFQSSEADLQLPALEHTSGDHYQVSAYDILSNPPLFSATTPYIAGSDPQFSLSVSDLESAGMYTLKLELQDASNNTLLSALHYLQVNQTTNTNSTMYGPVTILDVRMEIWDECADVNFLIDRQEFPDYQVVNAIRKPVMEWNESTPPGKIYDIESFPYHVVWLHASVGYLLRSICYWYMRNHLPYQSNAGAIDDMNKFQLYLPLATQFINEWKTQMADLQYKEDIMSGGLNLV